MRAPPISRSVVWSPDTRRQWNVISADVLLLVLSARVQVVGCVVPVTKALNRFQASPRLTCGGPSCHRTGCSPSIAPPLSFKKCSVFFHLPWKLWTYLTVSLNNAVKNWFRLVRSIYCPQHSAVCRNALPREGSVNRPLAVTSVLLLPLVLLHTIAVLGWRPLPLAPGLWHLRSVTFWVQELRDKLRIHNGHLPSNKSWTASLKFAITGLPFA